MTAVPADFVLLVIAAMGRGVLSRVGGDAFVRQMRDVNHDGFSLDRGGCARLPRGHRIGLAFEDHGLVELRGVLVLLVVVIKQLSQGCQESLLELLLLCNFV